VETSFASVLNCPEPVICNDFDLDVPTPGPEKISISEVQYAIKKTKEQLEKVAIIVMYCHLRPPDAMAVAT